MLSLGAVCSAFSNLQISTRREPNMFTLTLALLVAQGGPPDPVPNNPLDYDFGLRFAGETRQLESRVTGGETKFWTAEDGGRIRHSPGNNSNWVFQTTPPDVNQTLLDVWFEPGSDQYGWAAGRGGHLLTTTDGGGTWEHFDAQNHELLDSTGEPDSLATIWRTRWASPEVGFIAGLQTFRRNGNASARNAADFQDVKLWASLAEVDVNAATGSIDPGDIEFYSLAITRDNQPTNDWIGFVAGDIWNNCNSHGVRALGFYTDTREASSEGGKNWWLTFDAADFNSVTLMVDPWDAEYVSDHDDLDSARGYLVGGTGFQDGSLFMTEDGGKSWAREFADVSDSESPGFTPTLYGVAAMPDGRAVATGYGGSIWSRDPNSGVPATWSWTPMDGVTAPLSCAEPGTGSRVFAGGSFGVLRGSMDAGQNWSIYLNPAHDSSAPERFWRLMDMHFFADGSGVVVGQVQLVATSDDGGITYDVRHGGPGDASQPSTHLVGVEFRDRLNGVVIGESTEGGVDLTLFTDDGGVTWDSGAVHTSVDVPTILSPHLIDVSHGGNDIYWAVGSRKQAVGSDVRVPLILFTNDGGRNWIATKAPKGNLELTAVEFVSAFDGVIVGYQRRHDMPRAYRYDAAQLKWINVSPVTPYAIPIGGSGLPERHLLDVAGRGGSLSSGEVYTVGTGGIVYRYDAGQDRFVDVPELFDMNEVTGATIYRATDLDLISVSLAPGGSTILIGMGGFLFDRCDDRWKSRSLQLGHVFRYDGTSWERIRTLTDKNHRALQLIDDDLGFLLGGSTGPGSGNHVNPELGSVGDGNLLRYKP